MLLSVRVYQGETDTLLEDIGLMQTATALTTSQAAGEASQITTTTICIIYSLINFINKANQFCIKLELFLISDFLITSYFAP